MPGTIQNLHSHISTLQKEVDKYKKSFEELQVEQLFSEKVLDSLPGIFYLYDENGNLIRWNKNHEILTGFTAEELPKRKMLDWFSKKPKILHLGNHPERYADLGTIVHRQIIQCVESDDSQAITQSLQEAGKNEWNQRSKRGVSGRGHEWSS